MDSAKRAFASLSATVYGRVSQYSPEWPGAQLCHTSCFRQMARGDAELLRFVRNSSGHVTSMVAPGVGVECKKVG